MAVVVYVIKMLQLRFVIMLHVQRTVVSFCAVYSGKILYFGSNPFCNNCNLFFFFKKVSFRVLHVCTAWIVVVHQVFIAPTAVLQYSYLKTSTNHYGIIWILKFQHHLAFVLHHIIHLIFFCCRNFVM